MLWFDNQKSSKIIKGIMTYNKKEKMKIIEYRYKILVSSKSKLKIRKFREILRVVYKMLELSTLVESEITRKHVSR